MRFEGLEERRVMAAVPINNASFEADVLGDGSATGAITNWSVAGAAGAFNPTAGQMPAQATNGSNVAYSNGGTISQILGTNLAANTVYTLQVDLGDRIDLPDGGNPANALYSVELWAGGVQLASVNQFNGPFPTNGVFTPITLQYVSPFAGAALEIRLAASGPQFLFDNVRLDASTSAATDDSATAMRIPLQSATAIFSQGGFPVTNIIDGNAGTGWADDQFSNGLTPPNTAAVETAYDLNPSGATIPLTFTMVMNFGGQHTIGRFRLSATTADRSTFADGGSNVGASGIWTVLTPLAFNAADQGTTYTVLGDNSILVTGNNPATATYTIQTTSNLAKITGFRLEVIEDAALPTSGGPGGPGRAPNGNFVLQEFGAFVGAPAVTLQNTTAAFSQGGFDANPNLTDGNLGSGWANSALDDNTAVFETATNLNPAGQTILLTFTIYSGGFSQHTLGKFRFSATSDDRNSFADGLSNGGDVTPTNPWNVLTPVSVQANRATLTIQPDGSVLASGGIDETEYYHITVATNQANITGFRLEALADPALPFTGPGRAPGNGNFVVYEVRVKAETNVIVTNANVTVPVAHVLANDFVAAGGVQSISAINTTGTAGTVAINAGSQTVSYNPTLSAALKALGPGKIAFDRFSYTLNVNGVTETATTTVVVIGVNDPPVTAPDAFPAIASYTTNEDTILTVNSTAPVVPYVIPAGTAGTQNFGGALGMDFNTNRPILVTQLGVFDAGSNGLSLPITARLWNRATQSLVATIPFAAGATGTLVGGSRFLPLASPILLPAGFQGTIVAEGYGATELNGNSGAPPWTTNTGGGAVSFVGLGRFNPTAGLFPSSVDGGPANRYAAGTFQFVEPLTLISNDTEFDTGQTLTAVPQVVMSANGATVTINADGTFSYNPTTAANLQALAVGEFLDDTFTYQATDGIVVVPGTATIRVTGTNDPPVAVAGSYTIFEGEDLVLDGTGSFDVDTSQTPLLQYFWDLDNDAVTDVVGDSPTVPWADLITYGINDGVAGAGTDYTITLTVQDSNGSQNTTTGTVTVINSAPTVILGGASGGVVGAPLTFTIEIVDPSPLDQAALADVHLEFDTSDWDPLTFDYQTTPGMTPESIPQAFTPLAVGVSNLLAFVTDQDGDVGMATWEVSIGLVFQDPETGNVVVGGLDTEADRIVFYNGGGGRVLVRIENSMTVGTPSAQPRVNGPFVMEPGARLIAYGNGGADNITTSVAYPVEFHGGADADYLAGGTLDDSLFGDAGQDRLLGGTGNDYMDGGDDKDSMDGGVGNDTMYGGGGNDTMLASAGDDTMFGGDGNDSMNGTDGNDLLFGDAGNDTIAGGNGHDVLNGGDDNDRLIGDAGRDILIGGNGVDNLNGGVDDDVVVGGRTTYDDTTVWTNVQALAAIRNEWAFLGRTYAQRITNLRTGGGLTLGNILAPPATVTNNDGAIDTVTGGTGTDWFLASTTAGQLDKTDRVSGETLN